MKKLLTCLFITFVGILFANPMLEGPYITEIFFDTNGWSLELHNVMGEENLDNCKISSNAGEAYFLPGISFHFDSFIVVTQIDLQSPLILESTGDSITSFYYEGEVSHCSFGTLQTMVIAPTDGQSLREEVFWTDMTSSYIRFCKDNTPSMGVVNDTTDYKGHVHGRVWDAQMNPVPNAQISFEPCNFNYSNFYSNPYGLFAELLPALNTEIQIRIEETVYLDTLLSIEPGPYQIDFILENYVHSEDYEIPLPSSYYNLTNYPNPFNPSTEISFSVPQTSSFVTIEIFNSRGQIIKTIKIPNSSSQNPNQIT